MIHHFMRSRGVLRQSRLNGIVIALAMLLALISACGTGRAGMTLATTSSRHASDTAYILGVSGKVLAVNLATGADKLIPVAADPVSLIAEPSGNGAYVASFVNALKPAGAITAIGAAGRQVGKPVRVGAGPYSMTITPNGKLMFVSCGWSRSVWVLSLPRLRLQYKIVGTGPVVVSPDGRTAYVVSSPSTVVPVAIATGHRGRPVRVASGAKLLQMTPNGKILFVLSDPDPDGKVRSTVTPILVATRKVGRPIPVGRHPDAMTVTPDGRTLYVVNTGSGTVTAINALTEKAGRPIRVGALPYAIAITPNGHVAYVTDHGSNTVVPISTASDKAGMPIRVGSGPGGIAITPDGTVAIVVNFYSNTMTRIITATDKTLKPVRTEFEPELVVIAS